MSIYIYNYPSCTMSCSKAFRASLWPMNSRWRSWRTSTSSRTSLLKATSRDVSSWPSLAFLPFPISPSLGGNLKRHSLPTPCRIFANFSTLSLYPLQFTPPRWGLCFPGIEPMFDRCVWFGLLFTSYDDLGRTFILPYGTFSSADASNLLISISGLLHVGLKPSIYGRAARL